MINFKQSAFINAPVEKVFKIIADPGQIPRWRNDVPAISGISGETMKGSGFMEEVHFMGKKQLLMKVIEYVPDKRLVIEAQGGMSLLPTQSFTFQAEDGRTRIDLEVTMKVSGIFVLMQFMLPGQLKKTWAKYFDNLNRLVKTNQ